MSKRKLNSAEIEQILAADESCSDYSINSDEEFVCDEAVESDSSETDHVSAASEVEDQESASDSDNDIQVPSCSSANEYISKNRTRWKKDAPAATKIKARL